MREFSPDHPKATLMTAKRAAILRAARDAFLRDGYSGVSMEDIAVSAGVSIMTLYRHAESKDDLFAAVIASACHPEDQDHRAQIEESLKKTLAETLEFVGVMFQERLADPATTGLFRTVMVETRRFPHLADLAYRGLIGSHLDTLDTFLAERAEFASIGPEQRRKLAAGFLDRLVGLDSFRVLFGLGIATEAERLERARAATREMLARAEFGQ
jgi:TetR/AcrR family transcriptional regulator, mexJK operon transcriptional repressor